MTLVNLVIQDSAGFCPLSYLMVTRRLHASVSSHTPVSETRRENVPYLSSFNEVLLLQGPSGLAPLSLSSQNCITRLFVSKSLAGEKISWQTGAKQDVLPGEGLVSSLHARD